MAKQVKAYVDIEPYADVVSGRESDPASVIAATQYVDEFGEALSHVAEAVVGASSSQRILSGPHGCGKSTLLTVLYALASNPELRSRSTHHAVRTAASYMQEILLIPVFVDPTESDAADFDAAVREGLRAASGAVASAGVPASEWESAAEAGDALERTLALLPPGGRLVLFVDGVSPWLRAVERDVARAAVAALQRYGELAAETPLSILVALDEEHLEGGSPLVPLLRWFQVEYMPFTATKHLIDHHIYKKEARQRNDLAKLYDALLRLVPGFRWSREDFVALYPLHPSTLEVACAVRRYAPGFSLPRFAAAAGNRAKGRRELSLIGLDEVFDTAEYELRKARDMAASFEIYDDFANNTIPKFTESPQRFWAKVVLKGLFLSSLAGRAVTGRDLAAALMLYDEADPEMGPRTVAAILGAFEERAAQRFVIEGEGDARSYRLPTAQEGSGARVVVEIAREFGPDDVRLAEALVGLGKARFPDWPAGLDGGAGFAELEVPWHGTWRPGRVSYRVPIRLEQIPPVDADMPLPHGDALLDFDDDDILGVAAALDGPAMGPGGAEPSPERMVVTFTAAPSICEDDWEVSLVSMGSPIELRDGPETLVLWIPGEPSDEDLLVLKRLAALRSGDPRLEENGVDVAALTAEAEAEGGLVFHHLYLEKGRFVGSSWELKAADQAARETLGGLLARILDAPLGERYPHHPVFGGELDEATVRLLIEKFFVGNASTPNVQQAAGALAAPLGLAEAVDRGPYRFNPNGETALVHPFNVEPLRLAEAAGEVGVPLDAIYQALRREPFGLLRPAQRLILAAMIASGRLMLTGPTGELTAEGLEDAGDLDEYTHLRRAGLSVYPNETLLEWCRLVTDAEHLNDLVTSDGRQLIRLALEDWLHRWHELNVQARFSEVPPEAATRRTWQLVAASKQYFDTSARSVQAVLDEEIPLEEGLGRIVTTFAANPTIYQRALRDLKMLTSFVDWVPFYTTAKEYILTAERTAEAKIESERTELIDFITAPHRLLDESKRRRFETVYETFLHDYVDYYAAAHDVHVGSRADFEALDAFLDSDAWMRFQLLSNVRIVNGRYYQFAVEFVQAIRDISCDLPTRELLHDRPSCVCGFRLGHADGFARMFERLRLLVDQGTKHHTQTVRQLRQPILSGLRLMPADASYADASVPLMALLSGNEAAEVTPSTVDLINRCLVDQALPVMIATPPALEPGQPITKDELRARVLKWLEELPGDDGVFVEIGRALPAGSPDE